MGAEAQQLLKALRKIGAVAVADELSEEEVAMLFVDEGFFDALGYEEIGRTLQAQRGKRRKRFDIALRDFNGQAKAIIDFKRTSVKDFKRFENDLKEKYVIPELARFGGLTNGRRLQLYKRQGRALLPIYNIDLQKASEADAQLLWAMLKREVVEPESLASVRTWLEKTREEPVRVSAPGEEGGRLFLHSLSLRGSSIFGQLLQELSRLLNKLLERSRFAQGSFEFWKKTYARDLSEEEIPKRWQEFIGKQPGKEKLYQFMFVLESGQALVSRLVLAKMASDLNFPGLDVTSQLQATLESQSSHGQIPLAAYAEALSNIFDKGARELFPSVFDSDIFDWWADYARVKDEGFLKALATLVLSLIPFDFSGLSSDLLGELYQAYFDPEIRKALGEFYTPPEIVRFILDQVGYQGRRDERLLDPACGSGTFLVEAVRRFIKKNRHSEPAALLKALVDGTRIVGFDVNPFAVLMAQMNYAAQILPLYAKAIREDPEFSISRLPVFRTDSLRKEEMEQGNRAKAPIGQGELALRVSETELQVCLYLPVKVNGGFLEVSVHIPSYEAARHSGLIDNLQEYFTALHLLFTAVKRDAELKTTLEVRFDQDRAEKLAAFLEPSLTKLLMNLKDLREKHEDGRFVKTLEDLVLAVILKSHRELQYDFVVGNPPYVRIQELPETLKRYWAERNLYKWLEGNYDLYVPFIERGIEWLKDGGKLGYIVSNRFLLVNYGQKLRESLPTVAELELVVDFRDTRVFKGALNYPAVLVLKKTDRAQVQEFKALRVFEDPEEGSEELLREIRHHIAELERSREYRRGYYTDAFFYRHAALKGEGWHLMPIHERKVFLKLENAATGRLADFTESKGGGFAGYQTSADDDYVLRLVEDLGNTIKAVPKGGGDAVEIEKGILRPFLFGKDVERWHIDWNGFYVLFPYRQDPKDGRYKLLPSREYQEKFDYHDPNTMPYIEDLFPKAWEYLNHIEDKLRKREDNRFTEEKREAHLWYGATRPQNLEQYDKRKILLQLLSQDADYALDLDGGFVFQAGGKGGGVYGILPDQLQIDPWYLLALLNSRVLDFYLKHISTIYTGRAYSYGDQFIKQLPIKLPQTGLERDIARRLRGLAIALTKLTGKLREQQGLYHSFPESLLGRLPKAELYTLKELASEVPSVEKIELGQLTIGEENDIWHLHVAAKYRFSFQAQEHTQILQQIISIRGEGHKVLKTEDLLAVRLPIDPKNSRKLLNGLTAVKEEIASLQEEIELREAKMEELICALYRLSAEDKRVITRFLDTF